MEEIIVFFACSVPSWVEGWLDRKGEDRKGKRKDTLWLLVAASAMAAGTWRWLGYNPLAVLSLILGWRVLVFDYWVTYLLKKNDVISPTANWFTYTGKTSKIDKVVAKIPPVLRLLIRVAVFGCSVGWFY